MRGLLIKDFLNLKGFGKTSVVVIGIYVVVSVVSGNVSMLSAMLLVFTAMLPMTSTALDEQAKWNAYACAMPVSRAQVVRSKYLMGLSVTVAALLFSLLVSAVSSLFIAIDWAEALTGFAVMLCAGLIINTITLPIIYKMGVEKARLVIMIAFMVCLSPFLIFRDQLGWLMGVPLLIFLIIALALFVVSCVISTRIFEGKEF